MTAANPWLDRGVFHWAHQGGAREGPSNTLHAMRTALAAGADGLEVDVHRTRDHRLVLIHDDDVARTTNGSGKVADASLEELRQLDAAYWWVPGKVADHDPSTPVERYQLRGRAPADRDLGIPTLDELLDAYPLTPLTIEVKDEDAVEPLVRLLEERSRRDVIATSFKDSTVRELRRLAPDLPLAPGRLWNVAFLSRARVRFPPAHTPYVALQLPLRFRFLPVLSRKLVDAAHRAGLAVHAWTIDDDEEIRQVVDMGVDGIMTDRPTVLANVLGRSGP